jgi:putative oxidoreductase
MKRDDPMLDAALFALRLIAGLIMFYYGCQKFFGLFGGMGFVATIEMFRTKMGIPNVMGVLAILAEFLGGLGLLFGLITRVAAFGLLSTMLVATFIKVKGMQTWVATADVPNPIMDPGYPLLIGVIALALMLTGAGKWSLDQKFFGKRR